VFFDLERLFDLPLPAPPADPVPDEAARRILLEVAELQRVNAELLRRLREYQARHGSAFPDIAP
jgi:hypothetical protein